MIAVNLGAPWLGSYNTGANRAFALLVRNLLENLVTVNRISIRLAARSGKPLPKLYSSSVVYQTEPPGYDSFVDMYHTLRAGHGDCAHLAAWRVAELQEEGEAASLKVEWRVVPERPKLFHVLVRRGNGTVEDPSRILGMKG